MRKWIDTRLNYLPSATGGDCMLKKFLCWSWGDRGLENWFSGVWRKSFLCIKGTWRRQSGHSSMQTGERESGFVTLHLWHGTHLRLPDRGLLVDTPWVFSFPASAKQAASLPLFLLLCSSFPLLSSLSCFPFSGSSSSTPGCQGLLICWAPCPGTIWKDSRMVHLSDMHAPKYKERTSPRPWIILFSTRPCAPFNEFWFLHFKKIAIIIYEARSSMAVITQSTDFLIQLESPGIPAVHKQRLHLQTSWESGREAIREQ